MTETITAKQGAQPHIHGVRVGVMRLGRPDGVGVARLALRTEEESRIELMREGETVQLFDRGTLTLRTVLLPGEEFERGAVVLDFDGDASGG